MDRLMSFVFFQWRNFFTTSKAVLIGAGCGLFLAILNFHIIFLYGEEIKFNGTSTVLCFATGSVATQWSATWNIVRLLSLIDLLKLSCWFVLFLLPFHLPRFIPVSTPMCPLPFCWWWMQCSSSCSRTAVFKPSPTTPQERDKTRWTERSSLSLSCSSSWQDQALWWDPCLPK